MSLAHQPRAGFISFAKGFLFPVGPSDIASRDLEFSYWFCWNFKKGVNNDVPVILVNVLLLDLTIVSNP